jgi:hypothetical protein
MMNPFRFFMMCRSYNGIGGFGLVVVVLAASLSACMVFQNPQDNDPEPPAPNSPFFPLSMGNQWVYAETTFIASDTAVSSYSNTIISSRQDSLGTWWGYQYSWSPTPSKYEWMSRNDTVFGHWKNGNTEWTTILYVPPPPPGQVVLFPFRTPLNDYYVTRSAKRLEGAYATPAGIFADCVSYSLGADDATGEVIVCSGIGVAGSDIWTGATLTRTRLVSYTLD